MRGEQAACLSRSWLAWVHIQQGMMSQAREVLDMPGCPSDQPQQARWLLLQSFMARTEKSPEAASLIDQVSDADQILPEDHELWKTLNRQENPGWITPVGMRLELSGGYTSNSKAGSPTDPGSEGSTSALGRMDLFTRLVLPLSAGVRPALEAGLKGHGLTADDASELSYLEMSARPGVILGKGFPRVLVGYKADYLVLNRDLEARRRFYEGHRGEAELETESLTIFAGFGRRWFHENGRTRWEFDGGLGGSLRFLTRVHMLMALAVRYYDAVGDAYDTAGTTGLVVARIALGSGFYTRLGATLGVDHYLNSGGELGELAHGTDEKRFDILTKLSAGLWSASYFGARFGLSYEFNWRDSTADQSDDNYSYQEHRLLLKTRLVFDLNPWAPDIVKPDGHVALDYGMGSQAGGGLDEERIQDLLRQDEAARQKIPYVADKEYQILVPCPEPGGEVTAVQASDPSLQADWVFIIDARKKKAYQEWKFRQAVNLTFDYLEPIPDDVFNDLTTRIARSKARRVVVYGDGGQPDSGEQLGKEISGRGIKNVFFVEGGAPALNKSSGGGQ
jgi:hypothetical protein